MVTDYQALQAACRESLYCFTMKAFNILEPGTRFENNWHIECLVEHLEANYRGELPWLIINISPRMLKSVMVAQIFPAWVLGKEPSHQFIGASYAHGLAERNVMGARKILQSDWYLDTFKHTRLSKDQNQKDHFTTTMNGQYKGTGIGGTITGYGARTILGDDLLSPKEGMSPTIRTTTNEEMASTLFSRFNDRRDARFIMIMQRIHEDDPTGHLMAKDSRYHLLKLPAEAKRPILIQLGNKEWRMEEGDVLSPRLTRKELDELRVDATDYHYCAQYLQEPVPIGGGEFREEWMQWYQAGGIKPREMNLVILVDAAGGDEVNKKKKKTSDWTVMAVVGLASDNNYYLLDMVRDRLNPTERIDTLFVLHRKIGRAHV